MTADDALARYDRDEAFRERLAALYVGDRPRFISSVISLAVSEGYGRRESVEFAAAVIFRIKDGFRADDGLTAEGTVRDG